MAKFENFEAFCEAKNHDAKLLIPDFANYPEKHRQSMIDHAKLVLLIDELNEGWTPDWTNGKWDKFLIWCRMGSSSGVGFALYDVDDWYSNSLCGSRLCFKSKELAEYAWEHYSELIKSYFVMQ